MKTRFNTYDIICMVTELQRLIGMRVNQVYDIDNRTYVIRLQRSEEKVVLLLESGNRFHTTQFEWPKNVAPSGFTMKLRKHLKNKRLEKLSQLGIDRIVDLQFGSGEAAYHVILELYDRGNIVLTDYEWTILNVLRPHIEGDKIRFAVKEKYPLDRAKASHEPPDSNKLKTILAGSKPGDNLKKILNPNLEYGSALIDHILLENSLSGKMKLSKEPGKGFNADSDLDKLLNAFQLAEQLMEAARKQVAKGYIIQKKEERPNTEGEESGFLLTNQEFHPTLYSQHKSQPYTEYETFDRAVDEFYSALEGQKIDLKMVQVEREAMKKLHNVEKDHKKRVTELEQVQEANKMKAELISRNEPLVEKARQAVQVALAYQMSWADIEALVKTAQEKNDPIASSIKQLKFDINHITLLLKDPYGNSNDDGNSSEGSNSEENLKPMLIDIDLSLTAYANARRYYDQKRNAAKKQQKTLESSGKALKSAERKTKQTLKEAQTISNIVKARKTYWFEKFYWFISSDNYLVIAGRDQQQNELLVKRYMRSTDIYAHADISGASSVVVKNPSGGPLPPRTLSEAGQAAVAYSMAWEAKVLTRAWWVHASQVSKSAPTGEYLSTGSFMIRGKKNYLLPEHLHFGFSFMFRLEDSCIERHRDERKPIGLDGMLDDTSDVMSAQETDEVQDIPVSDDEDDELSEKDDTKSTLLDTIMEEGNQINIEQGSPKQNLSDQDDSKSTLLDRIINEANQIQITQESPPENPKTTILDTVMEEGNEINNKQQSIKKEKENLPQDKNPLSEDSEKKGAEEKEGEQDKNDPDSDSSESFSDTHYKLELGNGQVIIQSKARTISEASDKSDDKPLSFPSLPRRGSKQPQKQEEKQKEGLKRGQRGKLKKIKDKYKDQDDEDRALRMEALQSGKESKKAKRAAKNIKKISGPKAPKIPQPAPLILEAESDGEEPEPELKQQGPDADMEMLRQLTGCPLPDDELLFAVPVVAPYSAVLQYKFKVKLTPGTSKRGKAAKTAAQIFLKTCTARERELLRAVREEDVARNFPGKVKLQAPQLHKHRK